MKKSKLAASLILSITLCSITPTDTLLAAGVPDCTEIMAEDSDTQDESASEEAENAKASDITAESAKDAADPDYVKGRPLTEEELTEQEKMVPPLSTLPASEMPPLSSPSSYTRARGTYPAAYSSRTLGYVTPVRNQSPWNTCWAFASLACAETSLLKKGLADASLDLSERHLAYFFYNTSNDPLGLTAKDQNMPISDQNYLQTGGNNLFTIFNLAKWVGAADESIAPYSNKPYWMPSGLDSSLAYKDVAHMQNAYIIPSASSDDMKSLILEHGAIAANLYLDQNLYGLYFNPDTAAYYYCPSGIVQNQNHTVEIVGWDDDYKKTNFLDGKQPNHNGAWLAKNSYGSAWGDNGYFWISYEDAFLSSANSDACAVAFDFEKSDNYDHNYQYDGSSGNAYNLYNEPVSIANVFKAQGNASGADERLDAVSFAHYTPGVSYSIQVYKNPKNASDPSSGTPVFDTPQIGSSRYAGYQTIRLQQPVTLSKGDTFSVVIRLSPPTGEALSVYVDRSYINSTWVNFVSSTEPNQSFVRPDSSDSWNDASIKNSSGSYPSTFRIKAFTTDLTTVTPKKLSLKANRTKPAVGGTATVTASFTPSNSTVSKVTWTSSNTSAVTITSSNRQKAKLKAVGYGTAKITAKTSEGITASVTIKVLRPSFSKVESRGYRSIRLTWNKVPGVRGYVLYRSASKNGSYEKIAGLKGSGSTSYTDKKLVTGKTYYYQLRTYDKENKKMVYSSRSYTVSCAPVTQAPKLRLASLGRMKARFSWKNVSGASGYRIYRSASQTTGYKRLRTFNGKSRTTYTNRLKAKGTYYYKICAYRLVDGKKVQGDFSNVITVTR